MTIIRDRSKLEEASTADLVETYNAMTGSSIKKFENRAIAIRRVDMALMAAADEAAHLGVKKGEEPQPMTAEEVNARRRPFREGSLAAELSEKAGAQKPIAPRVKPEKQPGERLRATTILSAKRLDAGTSRMQEGSARYAVWTHLHAGRPTTVAKLAELTGLTEGAVRGHLQKLAEVKWAELINE